MFRQLIVTAALVGLATSAGANTSNISNDGKGQGARSTRDSTALFGTKPASGAGASTRPHDNSMRCRESIADYEETGVMDPWYFENCV